MKESNGKEKLLITINILEYENKILKKEIKELRNNVAGLNIANHTQQYQLDLKQGVIDFMNKHPKEFTRAKIKKLY